MASSRATLAPSFLQWPLESGATLFGQEVAALLGNVASMVSLKVAGLLARPLFACTSYRQAPVAGMCMSVASMSRFVQQTEGRQHYRCAECAQALPGQDSGAPGSPPLRLLHLYILVSDRHGGPTPLRMKPLRLVVQAPPDEWAWGVEPGALPEPTLAHPTRAQEAKGKHWRYNARESQASWLLASSYRGEEA